MSLYAGVRVAVFVMVMQTLVALYVDGSFNALALIPGVIPGAPGIFQAVYAFIVTALMAAAAADLFPAVD